MGEIWKDIENYEGLYQVSNTGKVKSLTKVVNCKNNKTRVVKERILKPALTYNGYERVNLCKNSKFKMFRVNRLVAKAFISNDNNYPIINHKDGNKRNNNVNNLEWCSYKENIIHSWKIGLSKSRKGMKNSKYERRNK